MGTFAPKGARGKVVRNNNLKSDGRHGAEIRRRVRGEKNTGKRGEFHDGTDIFFKRIAVRGGAKPPPPHPPKIRWRPNSRAATSNTILRYPVVSGESPQLFFDRVEIADLQSPRQVFAGDRLARVLVRIHFHRRTFDARQRQRQHSVYIARHRWRNRFVEADTRKKTRKGGGEREREKKKNSADRRSPRTDNLFFA